MGNPIEETRNHSNREIGGAMSRIYSDFFRNKMPERNRVGRVEAETVSLSMNSGLKGEK